MQTRRTRAMALRLAILAILDLAIATPALADGPAAIETLTVEEAVALALEHNRRVGLAAMDVERAEKKVEAARTHRLPSLELQALAGTTLTPVRVTYPAGTFGTFPQTGPIPAEETVIEAPQALSGNVNATLAQPLTQLHRIGLNTKLNELSRDIEKEKLREERAAVVAEDEPLVNALLDAGIMRLRPVMITVGATVIALFPLAAHGGPLWEPLCYAQIGGLTVATFVTLLLVPVIYAIFVLDLKLVKWETQ